MIHCFTCEKDSINKGFYFVPKTCTKIQIDSANLFQKQENVGLKYHIIEMTVINYKKLIGMSQINLN